VAADIRGRRRPVLQPSSRMFKSLQAAASSEGVVLAFRASQAALNSALAVSKSWDEPIGRPPLRGTVTFHNQTPGMRSMTKRIRPMRCLPSPS
jgi:hypothetical protein